MFLANSDSLLEEIKKVNPNCNCTKDDVVNATFGSNTKPLIVDKRIPSLTEEERKSLVMDFKDERATSFFRRLQALMRSLGIDIFAQYYNTDSYVITLFVEAPLPIDMDFWFNPNEDFKENADRFIEELNDITQQYKQAYLRLEQITQDATDRLHHS